MHHPIAYLLIRDLPHYRQEVFRSGLAAVGFTVSTKQPKDTCANDALVIWNRYGIADVFAKRFEAAGALVFVAENGYLDIPGARKTFALALGKHNGLGRFPLDVGRSAAFPDPAPWRDCPHGDALLLPQRGIGVPGVAMPRAWCVEAAARLRAAGFTGRIRTRPHPGNVTAKAKPLERDLEGVAFAVTWASGAGVKTLMAGVPTFFELHGWIGSLGAIEGIRRWRERWTGGRRQMLNVVASAQWTDQEIASGAPFEALMRFAWDGQSAMRS
jgi:hypothetical protein